jgi:hypothetical protein
MKHILIPGVDSRRASKVLPTPMVNASLGGMFYDYLRTRDGKLAGVRYWIEPSFELRQYPVFQAFSTDKRFVFDRKAGYVDIVFSHADVDALRGGELTVDTVQDFGGDAAVMVGNTVGISFDCHV